MPGVGVGGACGSAVADACTQQQALSGMRTWPVVAGNTACGVPQACLWGSLWAVRPGATTLACAHAVLAGISTRSAGSGSYSFVIGY
jgi:hypothetical protein